MGSDSTTIDFAALVLDSTEYPIDGWIGSRSVKSGHLVLVAHATFQGKKKPEINVVESARKVLHGLLQVAEEQNDEKAITELQGALALLDL